jgi:hypothetical protein
MHKEISFESPEEMHYKIEYWSSPSHEKSYKELKIETYEHLKHNFTYKNSVELILTSIRK